MTVSALNEMETCPRRWALTSASYPDLWKRTGYPPRLHVNSLTGTVVHLALETVTKELIHAGCSSVDEASAIQVMRKLGGYTKIIEHCIERVLQRFAGNPRAERLLDYMVRSLRSKLPTLRAHVQELLSRLRIQAASVPGYTVANPKLRREFTRGVYPEAELRAKRIGWKGKADLLVLSAETCQIIDFKTGTQDDKHRFQLLVYALLWSQDSELNPNGRLADKLSLAYTNSTIEFQAPSATELKNLERDLIKRTDAVRRAIATSPPEARPSVQNCHYCDVRHLCSSYWTSDTQRQLAGMTADSPYSDLEARIISRHGPSSWNAVIEVARGSAAKKPVVLRIDNELDLTSRGRVRVIDALVVDVDEDEAQPGVVTVGALSEVFIVPA
jgi:CRISPR/Cas system-associated exonuclease Cas4 (RecB family)